MWFREITPNLFRRYPIPTILLSCQKLFLELTAMSMPKADEATRAYFHAALPEDPRVSVRSMFGNLAGFVNGHMFAGVFGERILVRLPEAARAELLAIPDTELFEPLAGRPLREYVVLPLAWRNHPTQASAWLERSLAWASELPLKEAKPKKRGMGKKK